MGCPPDPVEVSIGRSGERIDLLEQKYHRLIDEYAETAKLAEILFADFIPIQEHKHKERFTRRTDVFPTEHEPYADDAAQHRLESSYAALVKSLETGLCELRTRIVRAEAREGNREKSTATDQLTRQAKLHLAHREEDRAQWILWLKDRKSTLEFMLQEKEAEGIPRLDVAASKKLIKTIDNEVLRLNKIDAQTLMTDRDSLRMNENFYQTPYLDGN